MGNTISLNLGQASGLADFFDNVIELLADEDRWIKGALRSADGYCIEGAITKVYREVFQTQGREVPKPLLSGLLERALKLRRSIMTFNDNSALSHAEMIGKLRDAALRIRQGDITIE